MTWEVAVLISTALFAVVTVFDKKAVGQLFPSASSFNLAFGLLQLVIALAYFAAVAPTVGFDDGAGAQWAAASGVFWALGLFLFFHGLRLEELSRATPIQQVGPIFAAVVGVVFLGESLSSLQWAAILVVMLGAVLVTARPEEGLFRLARGRAFFILLGGSLSMGMGFIMSEQATAEMNVWAIQCIRSAAMGIVVLALAARPGTARELRGISGNSKAILTLIVGEGVLAPIAALMFVVALSLGPVSLVSTVQASRPLFTLVLGIGLSTRLWNVLGERLDRQTIGIKVVSVAMTAGGVTVLGLS